MPIVGNNTRRVAIMSSTLWTPSVLGATAFAWYDANDASTITLSGSNVTAWKDKSPSANNLVQASVAPTYVPGMYPSLLFPSTNNSGLNTPSNAALPIGGATRTIVFIYAPTVSANSCSIVTYGNFGTNGQRFAIYTDSSDTAFLDFGGSFVHVGATRTLAMSLQTYQVSSTGPNQYIYLNGSLQASSGSSSVATASSALNIGNMGGNGNYGNMSLYEVVMMSSDNTDKRTKIEGYLAWKWGLQSSLPSNHPYKSAPPKANS